MNSGLCLKRSAVRSLCHISLQDSYSISGKRPPAASATPTPFSYHRDMGVAPETDDMLQVRQ